MHEKHGLSCLIIRLSIDGMKKSLRDTSSKGEKQDFDLVRSYQVISLLNCIDKIVNKVMTQEFS